ncbi:MAG: lipase maturation factor family protein [Burkholderiales bacterium]
MLPLIGEHGLTPIHPFLQDVIFYRGSRWEGFKTYPSLFWLDASDTLLQRLAWLGCALAAPVALGYANAILLAVLWALYMSFVHVGQVWYGYGWEIQLLETGFLAIFLCQPFDPRPFPRRAPPTVVIWLFRWLIFRIMLGAGLIKMRGDACWRDLTCLYYHYETQPIPNPLSWYAHFAPRWFHRCGVVFNHVTELGMPWLAVGPRLCRHVAGVTMLGLQIFLVFSGNLSFLNYLTIVPVLACFDDQLLGRVLPERLVRRAAEAAERAAPSRLQQGVAVALATLVAFLSIGPIVNLVSPSQVMNTSFGSLDLVNTYGAFGSVGKVRYEIVFEGTSDETIGEATRWKPYEFVCKPGDLKRRPCVISPYQPRLDWQIWFAAMSTPKGAPWVVHLVWKLLHNDRGALSLLANDPFPQAPPRFIRARYFRYEFAPPGSRKGAWWKRTYVDDWLYPLSIGDPRLEKFLSDYGWLPSHTEEEPRDTREGRITLMRLWLGDK